MKYRFVLEHERRFPVLVACRVLNVSRSGYYAWRGRQPSKRSRDDQELSERIRVAFQRARGRYGSPRVHAELKAQGTRCSRKRVARLMRRGSLSAVPSRRYRRVRSQEAGQQLAFTNVLERDFNPAGRNKAWAADITFIPTREGWLHLAAVLDLHSRRVIGWSMGVEATSDLTVNAFKMAAANRVLSSDLVVHSDRGTQYSAMNYRRLLEAEGVTQSFSRSGDCWDNAVVESFFSTLKREEVPPRGYGSRVEARSRLFHFLEVTYNRQRRHSTLGYRTPVEFEELTRDT